MSVVGATQQDLTVFPYDALDARNGVCVLLFFVAFEQHRRINLQVPQPAGAVLMTCGNQATIVEERHTSNFRVLRCMHLTDDLHLRVVPKHDCVIKGARYYFRVVENLLPGDSLHLGWLQHDYLENGGLMAFHVLGLDALFNAERLDEEVGVDQEATLGEIDDFQAFYLGLVI